MTARIKEIKVNDYQGKKSYVATLDNDISGYFDIRVSGELKENDMVEYTVEEKKNKQGKPYNLLTLTKVITVANTEAKVLTTHSEPPSEVPNARARQMKFESIMQLQKLTHDCFLGGKLSETEALEHFVAWVTQSNGLINDLFKE